MMIDKTLTRDILKLFYEGSPSGFLNVFTANRENFFFDIRQQQDKLINALEFLNQRGNLWFSPGLRREALKGNKRGTETDIIYTPGAYVDIDVADGRAHKTGDLPRTKEEALALLNDAPLFPSLIVDSGHGLQAWWLTEERDPIATPEDIERHKQAHKAINEWLFAEGKSRGYRLDKMVPLVGLARLPGTVNLKLKDDPKPVTVANRSDYCYPLDSLLQEFVRTHPAPVRPFAEDADLFTATPTPTAAPTPTTEVQDDRERLRHAILALPTWAAERYQDWITVGLALKNHSEINRDLWHLFSRRAPGKYNEREADKAWDGLKPDGKVTLGTIYHLADQEDAGWRTRFEMPLVFDPPAELWSAPAEPWQNMKGAPAEFPTHILPPACAAMVEAMNRTYSVPPLMTGMALLGVASVALGKNHRMTIKDDHRQWGNLYILIAVPPGIGKSPILRPLQVPLVDRVSQLMPNYDRAMRDYQTDVKAIKAKQFAIQDKIKLAMKKEDTALCVELEDLLRELEYSIPELPTEPCYFVNDATSEAMARRMTANNGFIGVLSSEGRKVLEIARGKYSSSGSDVSLWLAGHGYDYYRQDRVNRASFIIENPCIAALVMTQPDSLRDLAKNDNLRDSGFLARWLYIVPDAQPQEYTEATVPDSIAQAYRDHIQEIITTPECRDYILSTEALDCWIGAHNHYKAESMKDCYRNNPFLSSWLSKLPEHLARLALLLHVLKDSSRELIPAETMRDALELGDIWWAHARQTHSLMAVDDGASLALIVWQWLDNNRERLANMRRQDGLHANCDIVRPRDLITYRIAGMTKMDEASAVLDQLHERGYLRRANIRRFSSSKPAQCFILRPKE